MRCAYIYIYIYIYIGYTLIPLSGGAIVRSTRDRAGDDDDEKNLNEGFLCYIRTKDVCTLYLRVVGSPFRLCSPRTSYRLGPREKLARAYLKRIIIKLMPTIFIIIIFHICI